MDTASLLIEAAGRVAVYLTALPLVGLVSWRLVLWPRLSGATADATADNTTELDRRLAARGVMVGVALLLALGLRAIGQTANAFGPSAALDVDNLRTVAIESRWGGRFLWQAAAAGAATAAFAWIRVHAASGWLLTALAALSVCAALPRTGHAMSHGALVLTAQTLHVLGAGLWLGTLAVAMFVVGSRRDRETARSWGPERRAEMLRSFAPVAITGAAVLAVSGALTAYRYLPDFPSLFTTAWGRALLLKVALVAVVALLGFANFRRFRNPDQREPSVRLVRVELVVALAVVLLTALLTALPSPGE